jgi:hypothetical protein
LLPRCVAPGKIRPDKNLSPRTEGEDAGDADDADDADDAGAANDESDDSDNDDDDKVDAESDAEATNGTPFNNLARMTASASARRFLPFMPGIRPICALVPCFRFPRRRSLAAFISILIIASIEL